VVSLLLLALGMAAKFSAFWYEGLPLDDWPFQRIVAGTSTFLCWAIPFFIFAGEPDAARWYCGALIRLASFGLLVGCVVF